MDFETKLQILQISNVLKSYEEGIFWYLWLPLQHCSRLELDFETELHLGNGLKSLLKKQSYGKQSYGSDSVFWNKHTSAYNQKIEEISPENVSGSK